MLPVNSIRKYLLLICLSGASFAALSQSQEFAKTIFKSAILDISDLRPSDPDQFFKQIYLRDSTYTYVPLEGTDSTAWILDSKETFTYSNQGNRTITVRSKQVEGEWKNELRTVNAYDTDNKISLRQTLSWSDSTQAWLNDTRRQYHYNFLNQEDEIIIQKWVKDDWKYAERTFKTYLGTEQIDTRTDFVWNDAAQDWLEKERTLYTYLNDELLDEVIFQTWNDSSNAWSNVSLNAYSYDENDQLIETVFSNWDNDAERYIPNVMVLVTYNDKGQVTGTKQETLTGEVTEAFAAQDAHYDQDGNLGNVLHSQWDVENESWEVLKKLTHFWSRKFVGTLDGNDSDINCIFANPYTVGYPWYCESLKDEITYTVEVYDLMGRLYFNTVFSGGNSFTINRQIPPGMYTVIIRGGLDQHTEKVLIRN